MEKKKTSMTDFSYSAAIPTRDRPEELKRCIQCILKQEPQPEKIIVVDDGNLDISRLCGETGLEKERIIYHHKEEPGMVESYNTAMDLCPSEWILILDDDIYLYDDFMERMIGALEAYSHPEKVAGIAGYPVVKSGVKKNLSLKWIFNILEYLFQIGGGCEGRYFPSSFCTDYGKGRHPGRAYKVEHIPGGIGLWRTRIIRQYRHQGKYGKTYALGSDKDMAYRVSRKHTLLCEPSARALHEKSARGRMPRYDFGRMIIRNQFIFYRDSFEKNKFSPVFFYWSILGKILSYFTGAVLSGHFRERIEEVKGMTDALKKEIRGKSCS
jgi:glycosyltransferase involved in cell wall biosynthesis